MALPASKQAGSSADERDGDSQGRGDKKLSGSRRRLLILLALPALALALSSTMVTTYLPVLIQKLSGPAVTGLLIGAEGLMALFVPIVVGSRSDRLQTRYGGRLPFLIAAAPVLCAVLVLMPLAGSVALLAPLILVFYVAYFVYYPPYRALYPDLVADEERGRSQAAQKTLREVGLVVALVGGGLLLSIWRPLPFVLAAGILAAITTFFVLGVLRSGREGNGEEPAEGGPSSWSDLRGLLSDPRLRWLAIANACWELTLGAIKAFVVLFFVVGLGRSLGLASAVLALAAVAIIAAALIGGTMADRIGHRRIVLVASAVYGVGLLAPLISQSTYVIAVVPFVAFAGGVVMTLAYSLMMGLLPEEHHGAGAGLYELSRGAGSLLGPVLAGIAIVLARPLLSSTDGYAAMWAVASAGMLLSIPALARSVAAAEG